MISPRQAGYYISFLIHGLIVFGFAYIPFQDLKRHVSIIELDFAITGNEMPRKGRAISSSPPALIKDAPSGSRIMMRDQRKRNDVSTPTVADGDVQGRVPKAADEGISGNAEKNFSGPIHSTTGNTYPKNLNYLGSGGTDERNFSFVRDTILQSIQYPERARRMGWEGKVILSFTVFENGDIRDVRIMRGSGISLLDENARDTITKLNIKRKIPVRLYVVLPVEYRLH